MLDIPVNSLFRIVVILIFTTIIAWGISFTLTRWVKRFTHRTKSGLDDAILGAVRGPMIVAILAFGVQQAIQGIEVSPFFQSQFLKTLFFLIYWVLGFIVFYHLIIEIIDWYSQEVAPRTETRIDEQILPFTRRILIVILCFVGLIILLGHFNINPAAINASLATLGVGSLAVALAAQATLSDTISGFVIMFDRPFRIGDRIEVKELATWGDVVDIGLRSTRILTRDHRLVIVPNSLISANLIVNHSIPSTMYRVQTHLVVPHDIEIDAVKQILIDAVAKEDWVMKDQKIEALFLEYQASGLLFRVRCWIEHYVETRRVIDKLNTAIYKALAETNIKIPFPQRVIHFQSGLELESSLEAFSAKEQSVN